MKHHYYLFSFWEMFPDGSQACGASYLGLISPKVTLREITEARKLADMHPETVLMNCNYLGEMTRVEFETR